MRRDKRFSLRDPVTGPAHLMIIEFGIETDDHQFGIFIIEDKSGLLKLRSHTLRSKDKSAILIRIFSSKISDRRERRSIHLLFANLHAKTAKMREVIANAFRRIVCEKCI